MDCIGYNPHKISYIDDIIEKFEELKPDVILIDANELNQKEIKLLHHIVIKYPETIIVSIMGHDEKNKKFERLDGIIKGYVQAPYGILEISKILFTVLG